MFTSSLCLMQPNIYVEFINFCVKPKLIKCIFTCICILFIATLCNGMTKRVYFLTICGSLDGVSPSICYNWFDNAVSETKCH